MAHCDGSEVAALDDWVARSMASREEADDPPSDDSYTIYFGDLETNPGYISAIMPAV